MENELMESAFDTQDFFLGPSLISKRPTDSETTSLTDGPDISADGASQSRFAHSPTTTSEDVSHDGSASEHGTGRLRARFLSDIDNYVALGTIRLYECADSEAIPGRKLMRGLRCRDEVYPNSIISKMVEKGWLHVNYVHHSTNAGYASLQLFAIPEDVGRCYRRGSLLELRRWMKFLIGFIDISLEAWDGSYDPDTPVKTYLEPASNHESLFYIFNTLSSPKPRLQQVRDHSSQAISDVLSDTIPGIKTKLYPYQKRSVATMLQREADPAKCVDPRKPSHHDMLGREFYFDVQEGILQRHPHLYEEPRGGVLAETMGYGKTLICLAAILATRGHFPSIPEGRLHVRPEPRPRIASLLEMSAACVGRSAIPWKAEFHALSKSGYHYDKCVEELRKHVREYDEPIFHPSTPNRKGKRQSEKIVRLCSATLVIVPPNLLVQWQHEIARHTESDALDVLVLDHSATTIPGYLELIKHDIVLITKARFEQEYRDNDLHNGKCKRGEETFQSPLTDVRWLRVICDEGHGFAGSASRTNALAMLDKMYIERRWVVSGTPSTSLLGVEVGLAANEISEFSRQGSIQHALQMRRSSDASGNETKDMERLRLLVVNFLKVQPWANTKTSDHANWRRYLTPFDANRERRKAGSLRTLLQSIIVRHRIEDIDIDLCLPPLHNRSVLLEPSYYDKLSVNLFILVLTSNAITSERTDADYMFHKKNRKQLELLVNNLRQSSFHWVGFRPEDIAETVRVSKAYLDKNIDSISDQDRILLTEAVMVGERALSDLGWLAFSTLHEIGVYVNGFPEHAAEAWSIHGMSQNPLLIGTVEARSAQKHVSEHISEQDPLAELTGAGFRAMQAARIRASEEVEAKSKSGSQFVEEPKLKTQTSPAGSINISVNPPKRKRRDSLFCVDASSPLAYPEIVGFSSAKLAYLVDQVNLYHKSEKIIIFYDTNNVAYWIAEALELLSIKFLIYANTLTTARRATYLATFNETDEFRILLMDLKQAAHGLHVACASRVYIVNPIWQPTIESQAIKRAHRIGQTKPVYVETLVLRGTLEEKMLQRRKQMTNLELEQAEKSLLDDCTMNQIIKDERFINFRSGEGDASVQVARLSHPCPLFAHQGGSESVSYLELGLNSTTEDLAAKNTEVHPQTRTTLLEQDIDVRITLPARKKTKKTVRIGDQPIASMH